MDGYLWQRRDVEVGLALSGPTVSLEELNGIRAKLQKETPEEYGPGKWVKELDLTYNPPSSDMVYRDGSPAPEFYGAIGWYGVYRPSED